MNAKISHLDRLDRMILCAMLRLNLPQSVLLAERVELCQFESGAHDNGPYGFRHYETLHAYRPAGHSNWYRPDLSRWVSDPLEGFRPAPPVHVTAPEHKSYVRPN